MARHGAAATEASAASSDADEAVGVVESKYDSDVPIQHAMKGKKMQSDGEMGEGAGCGDSGPEYAPRRRRPAAAAAAAPGPKTTKKAAALESDADTSSGGNDDDAASTCRDGDADADAVAGCGGRTRRSKQEKKKTVRKVLMGFWRATLFPAVRRRPSMTRRRVPSESAIQLPIQTS